MVSILGLGGRWALAILLAVAAAPGADALDGDAPVRSSAQFLASRDPYDAAAIVAKALQSNGSRTFIARREALQTQLLPLFRALPKTANGLLAPQTARYALHRHFVRKHSMYIHGLEPAGTNFWNDSSPVDALSQHVPEHIHELFSERLERHGGLDINHLALFAATIESLIHEGALAFLREAYALTNHSTEELLTDTDIEDVITRFLILFVSNSHSLDRYRQMSVAKVSELFPGFNGILDFAFQMLWKVVGANDLGYSFMDATRVVDAVVSELGPQQQGDCDEFTDELLKIEVPGTGRIKLSEFYASRMMDEPPELLRTLGALDEDDDLGDGQRKEPHVLIPNYMSSSTNCVGSTKLYALCCPDACDSLLTQLEEYVQEPLAKPKHILSLVQTIPSRTQVAPRQLGETLVRRLQDIADANGGNVPLHGRLFAQWMHFAYPHQCPLPARIGTTTQVASKDFARLVTEGRERFTSEHVVEYLRDHASAKDLEGGDLASTALWHTEDINFLHPQPSLVHQASVLGKALAFCGALFAAAYLVASSVSSPTSKSSGSISWAV